MYFKLRSSRGQAPRVIIVLAVPPCHYPLAALQAAFAVHPAIAKCLDFSSSDDDLPRVIYAHAACEMTSRNGQPSLSSTSEEYTRAWFRAEKNYMTRSATQKVPDASQYMNLLICDCEPNSLAESTFQAIKRDAALLQDPSVTKHAGTQEHPQTDDQRREACLAILEIVRTRSDTVFQPSPL